MRQNAKSLALRDPAMAALMGAIPGADFGAEFGDDDDDEFGADAAPSAKPSQQQLMSLWQSDQAQRRLHQQKKSVLYPNQGSKFKIERYTFSVNDSIVLGTASPVAMSGSPAVTLRPQRVTINAPAPGFMMVNEIKVANVSATLGGQEDAYNYNANGVGQQLDMPTVSPSTQASILGSYSAFVPPGFVTATAYRLSGTFKGPASLGA